MPRNPERSWLGLPVQKRSVADIRRLAGLPAPGPTITLRPQRPNARDRAAELLRLALEAWIAFGLVAVVALMVVEA